MGNVLNKADFPVSGSIEYIDLLMKYDKYV